MSKVDFHIHSCFTDGEYTPDVLVRQLDKNAVKYAALTDHDRLTLIDSNLICRVKMIRGAEFTASYNKNVIHILCYGMAPCSQLNSLFQKVENNQTRKILKILFYLARENVKLNIKNLKDGHLDLNYIVDQMIEKGCASNKEDAFSHYLNKIFYKVNLEEAVPAEDVINCIKESRGVSFLAHPLKISRNMNQLNEMICELFHLGLQGIEAYYPEHTEKETELLKEMANKLNILISGGSDFHGKNKGENLQLLKGVSIPDKYVNQLIEHCFK